jgi:signal transduction histidine kinase
MSIRLISYLFALAVMATLGCFVYLNNTKGRVNRAFFFFTLAVDLWIVALAVADNTHHLALINFGAHLAFFSATLSLFMVAVFTWVMANPSKKPRRILVIFGLPAALLAATTPTKLSVASVSVQSYGAGVNGGVAYDALSAFVAICLASAIYFLIAGIRRAETHAKRQLIYLLIGLALSGCIAALTNLVFVKYADFGPPGYLIFAGFTTYAVVKHRLFKVRAVVARSLAYILLLTTLAGLYGTGVFGSSRLLFSASSTTLGQNIFYVALAIVLAFTFQPLKRFFERLTDRIFFRDHYDSQEVLSRLGQILVNEFKLNALLAKTLAAVCGDLHIESGQMYVLDSGKIFTVEHTGPLPRKLMIMPHLQKMHHDVIVADELETGGLKEELGGYGIRVLMKLRTKEELVGYLLLGDKLNGDIYSTQDISLLEIFVQELAVAISNAKAYEDIAQFNATLQQKVEEATQKLQSANRHLRDLDVAKDEFISMASHQLRTPLTSIKGYLSMLMEGDAGKVTPQQEEFLEFAYGGSQRMVSLVSDLLNVSRMSSGKFMIDKALVDLTTVVGEEVQQLQQHAEVKHLELIFTPPKHKLPRLKLDENKTRQVIMNFIDNALYYTKQGKVAVSLERVGEYAELRVSDTGIGVPKDARKHLFTKFFRASNAQSTRPDGTGLGLFLAKRVVEDQGGTIIFESTEGKGSTFGFRMPLTTEETHGPHQRPPRKSVRATAAAK